MVTSILGRGRSDRWKDEDDLSAGQRILYKMKMLFAAILNRQEVLENSSSWRMVSEAKIRNKEGVPLSINVDGELEIAEEFTIRVNQGRNAVCRAKGY